MGFSSPSLLGIKPLLHDVNDLFQFSAVTVHNFRVGTNNYSVKCKNSLKDIHLSKML